MKYLLVPTNNSLSHILKCLSIMNDLKANGEEVHIAVSQKHSNFLNNQNIQHHILADIQETDDGGFPSIKWFSNPETITSCIQEEVGLIEKLKPDKILGVFRFTLYASSQIAKTSYDSLICGCMIPDSDDILGFSEHDEGKDLQKKYLDNFFQFAGHKTSLVLRKFGLDKIDDIRLALKGERTFLWDFPEFMPIQKKPGTIHIGPINISHSPHDKIDLNPIIDSKYPLAVVSFGTCVTNNSIVNRIVKLLLDLNYKVLIAAGGQQEMLNIHISHPRLSILNFAPLNEIFPYTSLLVTHGGQMTIFEALQNKVPVVVMPLQPEQAHNGVCLERIGCGIRLIPSTLFTGFPDDYINSFNKIPDYEIKSKISNLVNNDATNERLVKIKEAIDRYQGTKALVDFLR